LTKQNGERRMKAEEKVTSVRLGAEELRERTLAKITKQKKNGKV